MKYFSSDLSIFNVGLLKWAVNAIRALFFPVLVPSMVMMLIMLLVRNYLIKRIVKKNIHISDLNSPMNKTNIHIIPADFIESTLLTLLLLFVCAGASGQTLTLDDLPKVVDFEEKTPGFLEKKGFLLVCDSMDHDTYRLEFAHTVTSERLYVRYNLRYLREGGYEAEVCYNFDFADKASYLRFLASLKRNSGYTYSKQNKHYIKRVGTYIYETVSSTNLPDDKETYFITYTSHRGKEVMPTPGSPSLVPQKE